MNRHPAPITAPLAAALQGGYTFTISGHDIAAHHISGKTTTYRIAPNAYYYPIAGKQPTKAQAALIEPVLQAITAHGVDARQLDPAYIAANAPPPPKPQKAKPPPGIGLVAAGYAFAPLYFVGSLLWGTAKHYK